ncbi:434_t:CDS:2 [Paraglomus brasilianum]|uniref:434_t:CDS:1 n=1 Tax=Paraglomus brasilianum TaxID=144538 RepID=A0A9N9BK68_9GLOM|nr:434_t:CDS:2 [Paraglomus brasilianum]
MISYKTLFLLTAFILTLSGLLSLITDSDSNRGLYDLYPSNTDHNKDLGDSPVANMTYFLMLTEGIAGGFKPPTIRRVIELSSDGTIGFVKQSTLKNKDDYVVQQGEVSSRELAVLGVDLRTYLAILPREEPEGGEDIYGLDISISFQTDGFEWRNGAPEGCTNEPSRVHPTPEQKAMFRELVERIQSVGQQFAINTVES